MAWVITKDHMNTRLVGIGIYTDELKLKECTKKFSIQNSDGMICYEGVATEDEKEGGRKIVIHAIGHNLVIQPKMVKYGL